MPHDGVFLYVGLFTLQELPIYQIVSGALAAVDIDLYDLVLQRAGQYDKLVIYIDKIGGVNMSDCAVANKQIQMCLSADERYSNYAIEVSSPGINRALTKIEHYVLSIGKSIKVKYKDTDCNTVAVGVILSVDSDVIAVKNHELGEFSLNFSDILKAKWFEEK
jgi:ribosome maturation factor RimP